MIVWHMSGNLASRFTDFLTTDGEKAWRQREEEFAARMVSKPECIAKWEAGWKVLFDTLATLTDADLGTTVHIRKQPLTVHGWVYGLKDGLARDMNMSISSTEEIGEHYKAALATIAHGGC